MYIHFLNTILDIKAGSISVTVLWHMQRNTYYPLEVWPSKRQSYHRARSGSPRLLTTAKACYTNQSWCPSCSLMQVMLVRCPGTCGWQFVMMCTHFVISSRAGPCYCRVWLVVVLGLQHVLPLSIISPRGWKKRNTLKTGVSVAFKTSWSVPYTNYSCYNQLLWKSYLNMNIVLPKVNISIFPFKCI